ncbi:MAG: alpha-E domain-containing protein [Chthoniobacteraceae bacterium]
MLSRVADSLYWLARYIERAENNARILDVNFMLTLDAEHLEEPDTQREWLPILNTLEDQALFNKVYPVVNGDTVCDFVTFAKENPNSIRSCVAGARENARTVREYISSEMWERINSLYLWLNSVEARQLFETSTIDFYRKIVDSSHQFHGTTNATLTHGDGWNFLQLGKYLERADSASRILDLKYHILLPSGAEVGGDIDAVQWAAVLKTCSAYEAYCKIHLGGINPAKVAEFLILHDSFPRSIRYCADQLDAVTAQNLRLRPCPLQQRSRAPLRPALLRPSLRNDRAHHQVRPAPVSGPHPGPPERDRLRHAQGLLRMAGSEATQSQSQS